MNEPMKKIDARKITILKIIVEEYIEFGGITWSKSLLKKYDIGVSSATVRNDMALLEKMGLIYQPYNSAGRLPTSAGMRVFVDYLINHLSTNLLSDSFPKDVEYDNVLQYICEELGVFACISEWPKILMVYGMAEFMNKNFHLGQEKLVRIVKIFENQRLLLKELQTLPLSKKISVHFPTEHLIQEFDNLVVIRRWMDTLWEKQLTLIGSTILDYSYMFALLRNQVFPQF